MLIKDLGFLSLSLTDVFLFVSSVVLGALKNVNKAVFFTSITGAGFVVQFTIFIGLTLWIAINFGPIFSKILIFYTFIATFIVINF